MTTLRVTQRTISATMMDGLQANLGKLQRIQGQLSSGKQISRPSDSPVQTVEAMQHRAGLRTTEQHVRNAEDGQALLETADGALSSALELTRRAHDLVLTARNASTNPVDREAIATELDQLRDGLLGLANTRYLDRPVFGGNVRGTTAFAADGSYVGDEGTVVRSVAPDTRVEVAVTGTSAFGTSGAAGDGTQLFDVLGGISAALRGQPQAGGVADLGDGLTKLSTAHERIITTLGEVGARSNRMETVIARAQDQLLALTTSLSEVEDIDLPRTIVDLQMQEVAYKAALGATARVVQPSLLDFLR